MDIQGELAAQDHPGDVSRVDVGVGVGKEEDNASTGRNIDSSYCNTTISNNTGSIDRGKSR